jgi:hypothetical protein
LTGKRIGKSRPLARISTIFDGEGTADEEAMDEEAMEKEREEYGKNPNRVNSEQKIGNPKP